MKIEFQGRKRITLAGLAILFGADAILAFYAMQSTTRVSRNELAAQKAQIKILKADIKRARAIQQSMPQTKADCERFENSLYPRSGGDSAINNELTEVAKNSGVQVASLTFHPKDIPARNMVELGLDLTVNGNYKAVVQFLNGLQRSKNIYIIDSLALAPEQTGQQVAGALRVAMQLRSYYKNAA